MQPFPRETSGLNFDELASMKYEKFRSAVLPHRLEELISISHDNLLHVKIYLTKKKMQLLSRPLNIK